MRLTCVGSVNSIVTFIGPYLGGVGDWNSLMRVLDGYFFARIPPDAGGEGLGYVPVQLDQRGAPGVLDHYTRAPIPGADKAGSGW